MNVTLPANQSALPEAWVKRIFARLSGLYGARFADAWRGCEDQAAETWAEALAGFSADEIAAGLRGCMGREWPPTLPEFAKLCRPPLDYESAFLVAVAQMRKRDRGQDSWPSAALFWAAASMSNDLLTCAYKGVEKAWRLALDTAIAEVRAGEKPAEVPPRRTALPAPVFDQSKAREASEKATQAIKKTDAYDFKRWARDLRAAYLRGDRLYPVQIENASYALGEAWERGECRPRTTELRAA